MEADDLGHAGWVELEVRDVTLRKDLVQDLDQRIARGRIFEARGSRS